MGDPIQGGRLASIVRRVERIEEATKMIASDLSILSQSSPAA